MTRHNRENRLISSGSNRRMKQDALFSGYTPTADLTAKTQKFPVLILLIACLERVDWIAHSVLSGWVSHIWSFRAEDFSHLLSDCC